MSFFILKNGKFISPDEKIFKYGDFCNFLFSDKIRAVRNSFPFFKETIDLLLLKFQILNQSVPEILKSDGHELKRQMERLLVKNKMYKSAVLSISFYKNKEDVDFIISAEPFNIFQFEINKKGLFVDVFDKIPKAVSGLSNLSIGSDSLWKVAKTNLTDFHVDDFLIINSEKKIIEGIGKKLFLIKGDQLFGVSVSAGAYMDVSGSLIPELTKNTGLEYSECNGFSIEQLFQADELFFLDAISGVQWILGFREKRYYYVKVQMINNELNKLFVG